MMKTIDIIKHHKLSMSTRAYNYANELVLNIFLD